MSEQENSINVVESPHGLILRLRCARCDISFRADGNTEAVEGLREIVAEWHRRRHYRAPDCQGCQVCGAHPCHGGCNVRRVPKSKSRRRRWQHICTDEEACKARFMARQETG